MTPQREAEFRRYVLRTLHEQPGGIEATRFDISFEPLPLDDRIELLKQLVRENLIRIWYRSPERTQAGSVEPDDPNFRHAAIDNAYIELLPLGAEEAEKTETS